MSEEKRKEKQFSDNLDRLLAGEQPKTDEKMGEDSQSAVDFAHKILECRAEPSSEFLDKQKERLLLKLALPDTEEAPQNDRATSLWERLSNLVPRSQAWRTAAVSIAVAVLTLVVVWRAGVFNQTTNHNVTAPPPILGGTQPPSPTVALDVNARIDKSAYQLGEAIEITLRFKNATSEPLQLDPFPPEIGIAGSTSSDEIIRSFPAGESPKLLSAGEATDYAFTWDQITADGRQAPPGDYILKLDSIKVEEGRGIVNISRLPTITILPGNP